MPLNCNTIDFTVTHQDSRRDGTDESYQFTAAFHPHTNMPVFAIARRLQCPFQEGRAVVEPAAANKVISRSAAAVVTGHLCWSLRVTACCCFFVKVKNNQLLRPVASHCGGVLSMVQQQRHPAAASIPEHGVIILYIVVV